MRKSTRAIDDRRTEERQGTRTSGGPHDERAGTATRRSVLRTISGAVAIGGVGIVESESSAAETDSQTGDLSSDTRDVMFTCNAKDGSVSFFDAHSLDTYRTIDVYPDGNREDLLSDAIDELEPELLNAFARENYLEHANISPDGRTLYASRGHVGDVVAIDIETGDKRWETELEGVRADHQVISPDGRYLFTSDLAADHVDKIDTETGTIVGRGWAPDLPHGNHYHELPAFGGAPTLVNGSLGNMVAPDSQTGDSMRHRLTFLNPETMGRLRTVSFSEGVRPFAITHDGSEAYVQVSYYHGFYEYDIDQDQITRRKDLPTTDHVPTSKSDYPLQSAHHGIDLSGDGEYICVAGTTSWYAAIVRRENLELVATIPVGEHPYWVQTGPTGDRAFLPVREQNEVVAISYEDAEEIGRVRVGAQPHVTEYAAIPREIL